MMLFTSLYSVVDGLFLSNFAGKESFSAVGFITSYLMMFISSRLLARVIVTSYAGNDLECIDFATHGFHLFAITFLFVGLSIFFSSFFTALNNGLLSAILSFCRVFVFQIPAVLFLPYVLGLDGIWLSVSLAESMTVLLCIIFVIKNRKCYYA